jgi:hypothetical protein
MADPENHTLHLLRKLDRDLQEIRGVMNKLGGKVDRNYREHQKRIVSLREAMHGESVVGRYATAEFDKRILTLEGRAGSLRFSGAGSVQSHSSG